MAAEVFVNLTRHPLSREENGVVFHIDIDGARFGKLVVSKGGLRWKPRNKKDTHHAGWERFDNLMREQHKR